MDENTQGQVRDKSREGLLIMLFKSLFSPISRCGFLLALLIETSGQATTINVAANADFHIAGQNLQAAIDLAQPGDTILVASGGSFLGPITLRAKGGSYTSYIAIRTSAPDASLPGAGVRTSPAYAPVMPKILGAGGYPAIQTEAFSHHYQLMGIEFMPASPTELVYQIVQLGDYGPNQTTLSQVPHHLTLDRCYVHAFPGVDFKAGILLNSASTDIVNSYISELHSQTQDTQALGGYNGPGPYSIVNNYLESSGINVLFGGAPPSIPNLVPSNILIARNDFNKLLEWKNWDKVDAATYASYQANDPSRLVTYGGRLVPNFIIHTPGAYTPIIKNLFEIKNGQDITLDGNTFSNNWVQADQLGAAFALTPRSENGAAPWSVVQRVTFSNNIIRHVGGFVNIGNLDAGQTSPATNNIKFSNNLVDDIRQDYSWDYERVVQFTGIDHLTFDHNTYLHNSFMMLAYGTQSSNFVYTNNIVSYGNGLDGDCAYNLAMLSCQFTGNPPYVFGGNAVIGGTTAGIPPGNFLPPTNNDVGFINATALQADYHSYALAPASPYKGKAADGGDPGFSPSRFDAARGASVGVPTAMVVSAGSPQAVPTNTAFAPLKVKIADAGNNPVGGIPVTFTIIAGGTGATGAFASAATSVTGADGIATAPVLTAGNSPGAFTVLASADALNVSFTLTDVAAVAPTADSASGITQDSLTQNPTFKYSSVNGFQYLKNLYALFNGSLDGVGACWLIYQQPGNNFYLAVDNGVGVIGPLGSAANSTISNSQCTLSRNGTSASGSGNTLVLTANLAFNAGFGPTQSVFIGVDDQSGLSSGWQNNGKTGSTSNMPPTSDSAAPIAGGFTLQFSSVNGYSYLANLQVLFNSQLTGLNGCLVYYLKSTNSFYIGNDAGNAFLGPLTPGGVGTLSNSQCTLTGAGSVLSGAGNALTVNLKLTFNAAFGRSKNVYTFVADESAMVSGWQQRGTVTLP